MGGILLRRTGLLMRGFSEYLLSALRASAGLLLIGTMAYAQFKEIGSAPFPPAEAHQKIRALLDQVDASNRQQTVKTIVGWVAWYRDVLDEELIAAWEGDKRANLSLVMDDLGDSRVASEIAKSWRQPGLNRADAPILTTLMARYADTATPFIRDMMQTPDLSRPEAEAVCRILLDLPDRFRGSALQILPHYRNAAQSLLAQDTHASDPDTMGRAQFWLRDLKWDSPADTSPQPAPRRRQPPAPTGGSDVSSSRPHLSRPDDGDPPASQPLPRAGVLPQATDNGARSGTLTCGGVIPQNAEFVFRGLPPMQLKLDYDTRLWDARLVPGEGGTQRLILRNISSGPQKKCVVRWSAAQ
jgi:hypothetical protein